MQRVVKSKLQTNFPVSKTYLKVKPLSRSESSDKQGSFLKKKFKNTLQFFFDKDQNKQEEKKLLKDVTSIVNFRLHTEEKSMEKTNMLCWSKIKQKHQSQKKLNPRWNDNLQRLRKKSMKPDLNGYRKGILTKNTLKIRSLTFGSLKKNL